MSTVRLLEYAALGHAAKVDRERCVVSGCKVLGEKSANPPPRDNHYPRATRERAIPLVEGARVYLDHPPKPGQVRGYEETLGRLRNVAEGGSGLVADFHYNPKHALAEQLLWDAENSPDSLGFSINADGRTRRKDGKTLVEEITALHSVDLVSRGATTHSLFEGLHPMTTLRERIEASPADPAVKAALLEMAGDELADAPMAGPAAAVAALLEGTDVGDHELAKKVMRLLQPGAAPEIPAGTARHAPAGHEPDPAGLTEARAKALCKLAGVEPEAGLLESLTGAADDKAMKLLEWAKGKAQPPREQRGPRSQGPGAGRPAAAAVPPPGDPGVGKWLTTAGD